MYISANMYNGLTSLLDVNADLIKYQTQALTGKKINQASDGLATFLTAQGYDNRSGRLNSINDGLTSVLSTVNAAKTGLDQVKKTLSSLRDTLKSASETQGYQAAQASQALRDTDPNNTQFQFVLSARLGSRAGNGSGQFSLAGSISDETILTQSGRVGGQPAEASQSQVFIGNQAMREGMQIKLTVDGKTWTFKVGRTENGAAAPGADENSGTNTTTVYTVGQLLNGIRNNLGIDTSPVVSGATATVTATYNGASFGLNSSGDADLLSKKGIKIEASYAAVAGTGGTSVDGYGTNETFDISDNKGYLNASAMFTSNRAANTATRVTYIEDQRTLRLGTSDVASFGTLSGRFTYDKTGANASYNATQTTSFVGIQHNYKAAVEQKNPDSARAAAAKTYRDTMQTINSFVADATTSGVNLLYGASVRATFNEDGLSQVFQITASNTNAALAFTSVGLGLVDGGGSAADANFNFMTNNDGVNQPGLMAAIGKVDTALKTVEFGASQVSSFQSILQDRKDFNAALAKLLTKASTDLTGADATEVAARASSLQVQQSFGQSILASTKQAEQALLQLLR